MVIANANTSDNSRGSGVAAEAVPEWQLSAEQVQHRISNLNFYCADRETASLPAAAAVAAAAGGVVGQVQASAAAAARAAPAAACNKSLNENRQ